jgi:arabinofuranan 3-O-arabinosyltransferase
MSDLVRVEAPPAPPKPPGPRRPLDYAEPAAYVLLGALVLAALLVPDWGMVTPDTRPDLYLAPGRALRGVLAAWRPDPYLGQPNFDTGSAPAALAVAVIRALGTDAWLAVRLWRAALLLLAGWGAARLFHNLTAGEQGGPWRPSMAAGRVAAAVVYVANPYVVVAGATNPILLPYALLPWLLLAYAGSLREPRSWRWPALFALAFLGCGGANAGVVSVFMLLCVPCYLAYALLVRQGRWRELLTPTLRCLALALAVSLYWLVPALLAAGTGETIARSTERPGDIASASSFAETLRLLGLWTLYGRIGDRLFLPNLAAYLTNPLVVLASFALPAAAAGGALLSRARARALAAIMLAVAIPVMVGLFPAGSPSPFGRLLRAAFDKVPGAIAFRTTNKAGALAALAIALLIALGVAELAARVSAGGLWGARARPWPGQQAAEQSRALAPQSARRLASGPAGSRRRVVAAALLGVVVLAVAVLPAWSGGMDLLRFRVPAYWRQAADDLDAGSTASRVLLLPGEVQADYRWGWQGPDDVNASLLSRPSVLRSTVPNGSDVQSNFLAALDVPLATGAADGATVAAMARYLGADQVLLRNDVVWEESGGARPSDLSARLGAGLRLERGYGRAGQGTVAPAAPSRADAALPPLQRYAVDGPRPIVRTEPTAGTLLIDGDNFALPPMQRLGLLRGQPAFQLLGTVTPEQLGLALDDGARIVLTDSNRRRTWQAQRSGQSWSPTLRPDQPVAGPGTSSLTLFDDPAWQATSVLAGVRSLGATSSGTVFGPVPYGKPAFAFDGDPSTAWLTGDFGAAVGQSISLQLERPQTVSRVTLRPVLGGPVQIAGVSIRLDGVAVQAEVPAKAEVDVPLPPTPTSSLTVQITRVRGSGINPVGFREIGIPGVQVSEGVRLPRRLRTLASGLDARARERLAASPLDVVLERAAGNPSNPDDDEERSLDRSLWLPDARTLTPRGLVRAGSGLPEADLDRLTGAPPTVVATSSSRSFDNLDLRASRALDGQRDTAWVPAGRGVGEWIEVSFPARPLDHLTVTQEVPKGLVGVDTATEAELSLDGGPPVRAELRAGASRIDFPKRRVGRVRLTITRVIGPGSQIRISEIDAGGVRIPPAPGRARLRGCVELARVDGHPLRAALAGTVEQLARGEVVPFGPCPGQPLALGGGDHRLVTWPGWLVDLLDLAAPGRQGAPAAQGPPAPPAPRVSVTSSSAGRTTLETEPAEGSYYLLTGQGYDPRWHATIDGQPLGPPRVLDGYSVGWRIVDPRPHRITVEFGPQRWASLSLVASLLALAAVVLILLVPAWWRRWRR